MWNGPVVGRRIDAGNIRSRFCKPSHRLCGWFQDNSRHIYVTEVTQMCVLSPKPKRSLMYLLIHINGLPKIEIN